MRQKALVIYQWLLIIGSFYALWILFGGTPIPCFVKETIGLKCPGCGVTRMFTSMLCLDFVSAFRYNPVMFVLFFLWNAVGILCILKKTKQWIHTKFLWILFWISMITAILYGILRNFIEMLD